MTDGGKRRVQTCLYMAVKGACVNITFAYNIKATVPSDGLCLAEPLCELMAPSGSILRAELQTHSNRVSAHDVIGPFPDHGRKR